MQCHQRHCWPEWERNLVSAVIRTRRVDLIAEFVTWSALPTFQLSAVGNYVSVPMVGLLHIDYTYTYCLAAASNSVHIAVDCVFVDPLA